MQQPRLCAYCMTEMVTQGHDKDRMRGNARTCKVTDGQSFSIERTIHKSTLQTKTRMIFVQKRRLKTGIVNARNVEEPSIERQDDLRQGEAM
jgi:hypothetical protein